MINISKQRQAVLCKRLNRTRAQRFGGRHGHGHSSHTLRGKTERGSTARFSLQMQDKPQKRILVITTLTSHKHHPAIIYHKDQHPFPRSSSFTAPKSTLLYTFIYVVLLYIYIYIDTR